MKLEYSGQVFEKYSNIACYEHTSSGSRVVPCGLTDRQAGRRTDRHPKLIATLRDFMNAAETIPQNLISLEVGTS
jgi:hypothetical protein